MAALLRVLLPEYRALRRFGNAAADAAAPTRFADRLVALGPVFVKLGQILSTRPDVMPEPYVEALACLQEHAPPVAPAVIRALIELELGQPVDVLFATFDDTPVAAASFAQVHRASLADGTRVAVKVRRPDLERLVCRDLNAMQWGLGCLYRLFPRRLQRTNLREFFAEFRRYTLGELDFAHEGRVIERFQANFKGRTDVRFPTVHWSHTRSGVITLGWVEGQRLQQIASSFEEGTKQRLVTLLVDVLLQMFVSDGLFHADLHPGNIVFHEDGTFTLIDFGMYGVLTQGQRDRFILYWMAVVQRQTRRAFHHFKAQTRMLPGANESAFFARFVKLAEQFYISRLRETSFAKVYLEMMVAGYEYGFVFPSELMLHAKALATAEALIFVLAADARFEKLSRPFIAREYAARAGSFDLLKRRASQLLPELLLLGEMLPRESIDESWDWQASVDVFAQFGERLRRRLEHSLEDAAFWNALVERHARIAVQLTTLRLPADELMQQTWRRYYEIEPTLAVQPTPGAVFTTHAAALMLAMHRTLLQHGVDAAESYRLIYDIGWGVYREMAEPPLLLASAFTRDAHKRLKLATDLFRAFPFGAPSYLWHDVPSTPGVVAFDCVKCPVAEFFASHNASQLCVQTFCQLDFPLAQAWGGKLERCGTIASGAQRCDFRWHVEERWASQRAS